MALHADRYTTADEIYLLSHSVGLAPRSLRQYVEDNYFEPWESEPEGVWPAWLAAIDSFRESLAGLFNDTAANFCPQVNVSSATTKILYSLSELRDRKTILLSEEAFPSIAYVFQMAERSGFSVKYLAGAEYAGDPEVWKAHMSSDVGLVLLTHVHSNSGLQIPVKDIAGLAREQGVVSVVDTAQSNGVIPIDVQDWNADFVVGSCVKWLCGGPGAGFLWANPSIIDRTTPIDVGWFSHADPFEFDIRQFRYATDALRFWGGTPSVLPYVAAKHAIDLAREIGIETIRAHNARLSERFIDAIDTSMLVSPRETSRRGGTVVVDPGDKAATVNARLKDACIRIDARATGIRLSPHIYNNDDDIDAAIGCFR